MSVPGGGMTSRRLDQTELDIFTGRRDERRKNMAPVCLEAEWGVQLAFVGVLLSQKICSTSAVRDKCAYVTTSTIPASMIPATSCQVLGLPPCVFAP